MSACIGAGVRECCGERTLAQRVAHAGQPQHCRWLHVYSEHQSKHFHACATAAADASSERVRRRRADMIEWWLLFTLCQSGLLKEGCAACDLCKCETTYRRHLHAACMVRASSCELDGA